MSIEKPPWVVILAAGDGSRVRTLTRDNRGRCVPKQFTSVYGNVSLLGTTLSRARRIAPFNRIVPIVAAHHERWWRTELAEVPPDNIVVQPENRGTAAGILLPLMWITGHDHNATVVILPSDHFVASEEGLIGAVNEAESAVTRSAASVVLLGAEPDGPEKEYGWIVPCPGARDCPRRVASFREKPDPRTVVALLSQGALLNTLIIVADCSSLIRLFQEETPLLWESFELALSGGTTAFWQQEKLSHLYRTIPFLDFSKAILESAFERLWVYPVQPCGWADLGTPTRLIRHLAAHKPAWSHHHRTTNGLTEMSSSK